MLMKKSTPQAGILNVGIEIGDEKKMLSIPYGALREGLEDFIEENKLKFKEKFILDSLYIHMEKFIATEIPSLKREVNSIDDESIKESKKRVSEFIDIEGYDENDNYTPVIVFEELYKELVSIKRNMISLREKFNESFREIEFIPRNDSEYFNINYVGNHKPFDITVESLFSDLFRILNTNSALFQTAVSFNFYNKISEFLHRGKHITNYKNFVTFLKVLYGTSKRTIEYESVGKLRFREKLRIAKEMVSLNVEKKDNEYILHNVLNNSLSYCKNATNKDLDLIVKNWYLSKYDDGEERFKSRKLEESYILVTKDILNGKYSENFNKPSFVEWVVKLYELVYCDVYLMFHKFTLNKENLIQMFNDIINHPVISEFLLERYGLLPSIDENNFENSINEFEEIELFKSILDRVLDRFMNIHYPGTYSSISIERLGLYLEKPTKVSLKNHNLVREFELLDSRLGLQRLFSASSEATKNVFKWNSKNEKSPRMFSVYSCKHNIKNSDDSKDD